MHEFAAPTELAHSSAFVIEPGHIPIMFAGSEYVSFTPTDEAKEQSAVMMPNMMKYAEAQGIELPGPATS